MTIPLVNKKIVLAAGFFLLSSSLLLFSSPPARASDFFYLRSVEYPLNENYNLTSSARELAINLSAGSIAERTLIKMTVLVKKDEINQFFSYPQELIPASDLYSIKIIAAAENPFSKQPTVTVSYQEDNQYKEIYYYDWSELSFKKIETSRDTINKTLSFVLPKKSIMLAVFNEPALEGNASWYVHNKYRNELIAASRDFAQNTKIKVTNLDNKKEVVVTIKDYGPKECNQWSEQEIKKMGTCQNRIVDLSKNAFAKLAAPGLGLIRVKITPFQEL
ncbi:MAG: septal ring lytic transglycosylase RlpA family protein [Patescibacteria group bacterium]